MERHGMDKAARRTFQDRWGVAVQAGSAESVAVLDAAIEDLVALGGDPVGGAEKAAADEDLVLARIYQAYLLLYGTTPAGVGIAKATLDRVAAAAGIPDGAAAGIPDGAAGLASPLPEREAFHFNAARSWAAGDWEAATRWLERALLANPRDLLALKVAQDLYFLVGNRLELRDVTARVLPDWPQGQPGWGYVQGIYAFGLEENGDYRQAQDRAQAALDHNPRDVWSVHAMAHVYEMEGNHHAGVEFLSTSAPDWSGSYFAVHNWWHKGLYHLELLELDAALALYDDPIRANRSTEWLNVVDAAALLWRLSLFGVDVTERARQLAADIDELVSEPVYIFNDWHAVMAFGLAGDHERVTRIIEANKQVTAPSAKRAAAAAGLDLLEAFAAYAAGEPGRTVELLADIRQRASAVGGSHAQRDVIDLTLIVAAARSGNDPLARALVAERTARKPPAAPSARRLAAHVS